MSCKPILFTYEADTHCTTCAHEEFGDDGLGHVPADATDSKGNGIGVLARWESWEDEEGYNVTTCGTCSKILCTSCGATSDEREVGSECWNCRTPWKDENDD